MAATLSSTVVPGGGRGIIMFSIENFIHICTHASHRINEIILNGVWKVVTVESVYTDHLS